MEKRVGFIGLGIMGMLELFTPHPTTLGIPLPIWHRL